MRVYLQELKKILRPAPLLLLAAFVALYSYISLYSEYTLRLRHPWTAVAYQIAGDVMELCGESLESGELERAYAVLDERYRTQLDEHIKQSPELRALGVTDYKGYCLLRCKLYYAYYNDYTPDPDETWPPDFENQPYYAPYYRDAGFPFDPDVTYTLTPAEQNVSDCHLESELGGIAGYRLERLHQEYIYWMEAHEESP